MTVSRLQAPITTGLLDSEPVKDSVFFVDIKGAKEIFLVNGASLHSLLDSNSDNL